MARHLEKLSVPSLSSSPSTLFLRMIFNRSKPEPGPKSDQTSANNSPTDDDKKKETYKDLFIYFGKLLRDNGEKSNFITVKNRIACDLKQLHWSPTVESGHRAAALVDLAKLLNAESHPKLDDAGKRAREGAMLIEIGEKLVEQGKITLEKALRDISNV